jgi:hypothetical protein
MVVMILPVSAKPTAGMVKLKTEAPEQVAVKPVKELLFPVISRSEFAYSDVVIVAPVRAF